MNIYSHDKYVFVASLAAAMACFDAETGEELWELSLPPGRFTSRAWRDLPHGIISLPDGVRAYPVEHGRIAHEEVESLQNDCPGTFRPAVFSPTERALIQRLNALSGEVSGLRKAARSSAAPAPDPAPSPAPDPAPSPESKPDDKPEEGGEGVTQNQTGSGGEDAQ